MLLRDPNAFAPILGTDQYLLLGSDAAENRRQISKFSQQDAEVCAILVHNQPDVLLFHIRITLLQRFEEYELWMEKIGKISASTFSFLIFAVCLAFQLMLSLLYWTIAPLMCIKCSLEAFQIEFVV